MDTMELAVLRFDGPPASRGRAHGETLRSKIVELIELWGDNLERVHGLDRRRYVELLFERSGYEAALAQHASPVLDELQTP